MSALSDFLTQAAAPWGGVPMGVLGGASIAFISNSRGDVRKRRDARYEKISSLCAQLMAQTAVGLTSEARQAKTENEQKAYIDSQKALINEQWRILMELRIIASKRLADAAMQYMDAVKRIQRSSQTTVDIKLLSIRRWSLRVYSPNYASAR